MLNELAMKELDEIEFMDFEDNVSEEERNKKYKIENLDSANWAFRKLKALQEREMELKQLKDNEINRINNWYNGEIQSLNSNKIFFEILLKEYFKEQRKVDKKFKLSTPYGKVSSRKQQPEWEYEDDKILEWLRKNDKELIRVKEEVNKSELKAKYKHHKGRAVTEHGEIIDGITITEQEDSITIKVVE